MTTKTIITLQELDILWAKHRQEQTGKIQIPEVSMELSPGYYSWCKRSPNAWFAQKEKRIQQLIKLDLIMTHEIDYYLKTEPITPY